MAISYDCVGSSLLCPEDNNSIMGFDGEDDVEEGVLEGKYQHGYHQRQCLLVDYLMGFPRQTDECLALMVERECQHLPKADYMSRLQNGALDLSRRRDAVDWIWKVHAYYSFGPLCAYLSINYLDRFLSAYGLPQGKSWMMQLLSVACLSLAAKMEETEVPLSLDLQVCDSKFVFEARTIQRMELLVLSTLQWRMQAVTPFSFIDYFLKKMNDGKSPPRTLIQRSIELILGTIRGIEFLEFRPSEVAAAVATTVLGETQGVNFDADVSCYIHVEKERVFKCYEMIQELASISNGSVKRVSGSVSSVPQSPIGVLDAPCLSYKSEDITVGSCTNSPASKRRKLNSFSEINTKS